MDRSASNLKEWDGLTTAAAANAADLPQLSQRMAEILAEGAKLATVIRVLAKQPYGNRSDKLVELGTAPFRGRARKAAPATQPPGLTGSTPTTPTTPINPSAK